ncbi:Cyanate hydratase [Tulasnella sp. 332]|nr:Cyanate hydratase [Tulasnella sp. 332]
MSQAVSCLSLYLKSLPRLTSGPGMYGKTSTVIDSTTPYKNLNASCKQLFALKAAKGCSFDDIAKAIGRDEVWTAALFYGQASCTEDDIKALAKYFEADLSLISPLAHINEVNINRGNLGPMPPTDPVIYRLYEVCFMLMGS